MKEPEKPKKPERKPEVGPGNVPPEMVGPLTPYGDRHENAVGKKICGTCALQLGADCWDCAENHDCPTRFPDCRDFQPKPRKSKPSQLKPERATIPAGVRFIYFGRPRQGERHQGVMTVAYQELPDGYPKAKGYFIKVGFALCSPSDSWVKAKGQDLAIQRLWKTPIVARYLYEPKRLVVQIAQGLLEHRIKEIQAITTGNTAWLSIMELPSWTVALARRLKTRKVSGISRLKLFERRSFSFPIPTTDRILRAMVQDILNLGGKP